MGKVVEISESGLQDRPRTQALIYFEVGASARAVRCNTFSRPVLGGNFVDMISQSWEITIYNTSMYASNVLSDFGFVALCLNYSA